MPQPSNASIPLTANVSITSCGPTLRVAGGSSRCANNCVWEYSSQGIRLNNKKNLKLDYINTMPIAGETLSIAH